MTASSENHICRTINRLMLRSLRKLRCKMVKIGKLTKNRGQIIS